MLRFIGTTTTNVPDEFALTEDVITIGRDAKCSLVIDSLTSPRMISRVHVKLSKTQPASAQLMRGVSRAARSTSRAQAAAAAAAAPASSPAQPPPPRWLLTDNGSVNGCFVNDIKVSSTLLTDGDVITVGGLGMKVPVGVLFPQPDAEFVFQFVQPPPQIHPAPQMQSQDATLPMPIPHELASDAEESAAAAHSEADDDRKEEHAADDDVDEDGSTQLLPPAAATVDEDGATQLLPPVAAVVATSASVDEDGATQLLPPHAATVDENGATQLLPPVVDEESKTQLLPSAVGEDVDEDGATQLLPPESAPAAARRQDSSEMVDVITATQIIVTAPTPRTRSRGGASAAAAPARLLSDAPTQLLSSDVPATVHMEDDIVMHVSAVSAVPAADTAAAAPPAARGGLDIHAYRVAPSLDVSMAVADESDHPFAATLDDGSEGSGVRRAMSLDATLATATHDTTQVLPSSQATTQQLPGSEGGGAHAHASVSASLIGCLDGMGMATQTQVLPPAFERAASGASAASATAASATAAAAAAASTSAKAQAVRKAPSKSDLYDDDEEEADLPHAASASSVAASSAAAAAAPAASSGGFASPSVVVPSSSLKAKVVTPLSVPKKRGRHSDVVAAVAAAADDDDDDDDVAVIVPSDDDDAGPPLRKKVDRKSSVNEQCPLCDARIAAAGLEAHVEACLAAAAADEADAAAQRIADELDAADTLAESAARKKKKPAPPAPRVGRGARRPVARGRWAARDYSDEEEEEEEEDEDGGSSYVYPPPAAAAFAFGSFPVAAAAAAAAAAPSAARVAPAPTGPKSPCPLCDKLFHASELVEHADVCEGPDERCPLCECAFLPSVLPVHARNCKGPPIMCAICEERFPAHLLEGHQQRCVGKDGRECDVCRELVAGCEFDAHHKRCVQREMDMSQDEKMAIGFQRGEQRRDLVNEMQTRAVKWVEQQARRLSEAAYPALLARFKSLGFSELDLKRTIRYIRNDAPLIIHVNLTNCMKFFVADTHYRNQFETKTSCGTLSSSARSQWENGLFNKVYDKATGYDRVKYGVLNIVQDPNGVLACRGYGDSYLLLKSETMRLRTSFASRDTGGGTAKLASCEWYAHVLSEYSDPELQDVISVATGAKRCVSSARIGSYKEVQYHGPVEFARDVDALVVNSRHLTDKHMMDMVEQFRKQNNCNVVIMEADGR